MKQQSSRAHPLREGGGAGETEKRPLPWQPAEVDSPTCPMTSAPSYSSKLALRAKCLPPQQAGSSPTGVRPALDTASVPERVVDLVQTPRVCRVPSSCLLHRGYTRPTLLYKWDHGGIRVIMEPQVPLVHLS